MVLLLGLNRFLLDDSPREIIRTSPIVAGGDGSGENGWLIRFFDSAFFCEWIAVSYLYKHDHPGVRDYLCNRMYALPLAGIESYLFQICYMLIHKPSPSLDKFVIDTCSKSLRIALKVHWFLMAELEDSEDNEGISRLQEKCQIAATLMGEWPPLVRVPPASASTPSSPKGNPVLNRILSSKQRLLSLASSPALGSSSPIEENSKSNSKGDENSKALTSSEENKLLKKLIPGPKVRDTLFFRKSMEKEAEESDKDGFFRRLLRDSKDKEVVDSDKDGFFRRLLSINKDEDAEMTASSESFVKRLFRDKDEKLGEEDEKDSFFLRIFKDKNEEKKDGGHDGNEEDKVRRSLEEDDKDGFFRSLFKDKIEDKKNGGQDRHGKKDKGNESIEEDEKETFFRRLFKDKIEEKQDGRHDENEREDKLSRSGEDVNFFRRLFKDKNEEKKVVGHDKNEEKCNGSIEENEKDGFFRRFFKDKHEEKKNEWHARNEEDNSQNGCFEEEETSEFLSFRRLFRVHPADVKTRGANENGLSNGSLESSPGTENFFRRLFRDKDRSVEDSELFGSKIHKEKRPGSPRQWNEKHGKPPLPNNVVAEIRKGSYHASLEFVQSLCDTSYGLVDIFPIEDRKIALQESLMEINSHLSAAQKNGGVCFPMGKGMYRVVHLPEDEAVLLNSREKAPYLICVEVLKVEVRSHTKVTSDAQNISKGGIPLANGDAQLPKLPPWAYPLWSQYDMHQNVTDRMLMSTSQAIDQAMTQLWEAKVKSVHVSFSIEKHFGDCSKSSEGPDSRCNIKQATMNGQDPASELISSADHDLKWVNVNLTAVPDVNMEDVDDQEPTCRKDHRRVPSTIAIEEVKAAAAKGQAPPGLPLKGAGQDSEDAKPKVMNGRIPKPTDALSGEIWEVKKERIRRSSVYGKSPGWDLCSMIVKSGDDCRQEHLAVQLVSHFYDIYQEAGLPLWLRPYEVLVTSSYAALIETIPDTASIHSIKSRFPNISSLRDYFVAKYEENSPNFKLSQRNFVESMAGYSILCYLLQIKDRHNGNLLIDEEGHIIHIDFGFMLSNSPGGVNFESAPFKLTRELLEVMDSDAEGTPSEFFDYFKLLCIQGFLTCRKHAERIILLVEMLQDSGFPCFKGGPRTIQNLRKRFHLSLTEEQCVSLVLSLISSSLDAWRTRQYDYYQRVLNGIL
ncbi:phosphatidylinositol 4-kinase beta 1 isoform X2 [Phoenix dactylifera]|uniref:1-phosphatidylinositol 4-kinase n=1 Tax=Phoenix dactylifera TaxID=42345 RepID=A0A8B7CXA4_PHODC|nr:phosphatidylinositol 4-kinase beta 1 isoform X2 [Phoenix dactylifera]